MIPESKIEICKEIQISKQDVYSVIYLLGCIKSPEIVVELGCWCGASTVIIGIFAKKAGAKVLYTVDNFLGTGSFLDSMKWENPRQVLSENLNKMELDDFVEVIESDSSEAAANFEDNSVDFIFIDADHRYSSVRKDILSWYPKVKDGGIFCGHDFEDLEYDGEHVEKDFFEGRHHGVIKATQEIFGRVNWLPDKIWWANKRNELVSSFRCPNMEFVNCFKYNKWEN